MDGPITQRVQEDLRERKYVLVSLIEIYCIIWTLTLAGGKFWRFATSEF